MFKKSALVNILFLWTCGVAQDDSSLSCRDWRGNLVADGTRFVPNKLDPCKTCVCDNGYEVRCMTAACAPPPCKMYEEKEGECCQFHCISPPLDIPENNENPATNHTTPIPVPTVDTSNLGLRLVASTVTFLLILALVLFLIHRLRRRRRLTMMRRDEANRQLEEEEAANYTPDFIDTDFSIDYPPYEEPPPPYTPAKTPTDAPPPYETLPRNTSIDGALGTANQCSQSNNRSVDEDLNDPRNRTNSRSVRDSTITTDTFLSTVCGDSRTSSGFLSSNQTLDVSETCEGRCELRNNYDGEAHNSLPSCSYSHSSTLPAVRSKTSSPSNVDTAKVKQDKKRRNSSPFQYLLENEEVMNMSAHNSPTQSRLKNSLDRAKKNRSPRQTESVDSLENFNIDKNGRHCRTSSPHSAFSHVNEYLRQSPVVASQMEAVYDKDRDSVNIISKKSSPMNGYNTDKICNGSPRASKDRRKSCPSRSRVVLQQEPDKVVIWSTEIRSNSPRHSYADRFSKSEIDDIQQDMGCHQHSPSSSTGYVERNSDYRNDNNLQPDLPQVHNSTRNCQIPYGDNCVGVGGENLDLPRAQASAGNLQLPSRAVTCLVPGSVSVSSQMSALSVCSETGEKRTKRNPPPDSNLQEACPPSVQNGSHNLDEETPNGDCVDVNEYEGACGDTSINMGTDPSVLHALPPGGSINDMPIPRGDNSTAIENTAREPKNNKNKKSSRKPPETEPVYHRLKNETSPDRQRVRTSKGPNTVFKQYGFVDDPDVLSARDPAFTNTVYAIDYGVQPQRSRSHERSSHKSRERKQSGERSRSRSGSRHRSRSGSRERSKQIRDRSRERALLHKQEKSTRNLDRKKRHTMDGSQLNGVVLNGEALNGHVANADSAKDQHGRANKHKHRKSLPNADEESLQKNNDTKVESRNRSKEKRNKHSKRPNSTHVKGNDNEGANDATNCSVNRSTSDNNINKVNIVVKSKKKHRNSLAVVTNLPGQSAYL